MIDQFYTPTHIAANILCKISDIKNQSVADFSIGDGSLIKNLPFKAKKIIGLDIDDKAIAKLKNLNEKWNLRCGDFLNPDKETSDWLSTFRSGVDLIVLNPPFSCKGNKRVSVIISEQELVCRPSIAFLYTALQYLNKNGTLIAIIPLSSIKSDIDNVLLSHIRKNWEITYGEKLSRGAFKGCTPNSIIITLKRKKKSNDKLIPKSISTNYNFKAQILRGSTPMFTTKKEGSFPVLHTINLQENKITPNFKYLETETKCALGTYLCIPRVGKPSPKKIVLIQSKKFILSDCLIGVRGECLEQTLIIKQVIVDNWERFQSLYESTCAPYITLNQLRDFFKTVKINSEIVLNFDNTFDLNSKTINNSFSGEHSQVSSPLIINY